MGTTFVTIDEIHGFWMFDQILEVWLRLLALHIPEPSNDDSIEYQNESYQIRNWWLLASKGYFGGHVPHHLDDCLQLKHGARIVQLAIQSLRVVLEKTDTAITPEIFSLMGGQIRLAFSKEKLIDIANAWEELIAGQITFTAYTTERMPGSH